MNRYVEDGEKLDLNWRKSAFSFVCCDCGLTHVFRFIVAGDKIRVRAWRDKKRTNSLRRTRAFRYVSDKKEK